ncbi:MAG TPA: hypothetical protein VF426_07655 [Marmoricola sp.]
MTKTRYTRLDPASAVLYFLFLVAGSVALALFAFDADATRVAVVVIVCIAVPVATIALRGGGIWRFVVIVVAAIAVLGWASDSHHRNMGYALCCVATSTYGFILLTGLLHRQWLRNRLTGAEGAPPASLDPTGGKDVGLFATWTDDHYSYEAVDPTTDLMVTVIRAFDGGDRSSASIFRGKGRLDIGGDARGAMIVIQSDDRKNWHQVVNPAQPEVPSGRARTATLEQIVFAGKQIPVPRRRLTDLASAETAVHAWIEQGVRDPSLTWWSDSARETVLRPRLLQMTD